MEQSISPLMFSFRGIFLHVFVITFLILYLVMAAAGGTHMVGCVQGGMAICRANQQVLCTKIWVYH